MSRYIDEAYRAVCHTLNQTSEKRLQYDAKVQKERLEYDTEVQEATQRRHEEHMAAIERQTKAIERQTKAIKKQTEAIKKQPLTLEK